MSVPECPQCGRELDWWMRSDAVYCRNACRQKAYLKRKKATAS